MAGIRLDLVIASLLVLVVFYVLKRAASSRAKYAVLSKIPGPRPLPVVGNFHQLGPRVHVSLHLLQKEYGPVMLVWIGPQPVVVFRSVETIKEVLLTKEVTVFSKRPGGAVAQEHLTNNHYGTTWANIGPDWNLSRKLFKSGFFGAKALDEAKPFRHKMFMSALQSISDHSKQGRPVPLITAMGKVYTDSVIHMLFKNSNLETGVAKDMQAAGHEFLLLGVALNIGDYFPCLRIFDLQGYEKRMKKYMANITRILSDITNERRKEREVKGSAVHETSDFLDIILDYGSLPDMQINEIMLDIIIGSTDSISVAVEWVFTELAAHPDIMKKAQDELDRVIGSERLVSEADVSSLPYLLQITKETFRLHPTSAILSREAMQDCHIGEYAVPKGTWVFASTYSSGRDPSIWDRHTEFDPDRFANCSRTMKGNDYDLLPFGTGRRMCPGMTFGLQLLQFNVALLLHAFDWSLPGGQTPKDVDMEDVYGFSVPKKISLELMAKPRLPPHVYHAEGISL